MLEDLEDWACLMYRNSSVLVSLQSSFSTFPWMSSPILSSAVSENLSANFPLV